MELVPILSTIILVGTIATFILAVAAYILYKIRERRSGHEHAAEESRREEPHVLVEPARRPALEARRYAEPAARYAEPAERYAEPPRRYVDPQPERIRPASQSTRPEPEPVRTHAGAEPAAGRHESLFWEYTDEGFVPVRTDRAGSSRPEDEPSADSDRAAWT